MLGLQFMLNLIVFLVGASVFSFLNVVAYRLPRKMNYVSGTSMCPYCKHDLHTLDLLPLFGFLLLRGKCRYCGERIKPRYLLMELVGGVTALFCFWFYQYPITFEINALLRFLLSFAFLCVLVVVSLIDWDTMEIPNGLVIWIFVLAVLSVFVFPEISLIERLIGLLSVSLPMFLLAIAISGAFGGGDIKLMAAAGLLLGWKLCLVATFLALLTGGAYAAYLLISKKITRKGQFPFGPFLCFGCAVALFYGTSIITWYLSFFF